MLVSVDLASGIILGHVTNRDGARLHLNLFGLASCGAGTGRILLDRPLVDLTSLRGDAYDQVCRRCRRRILAAIATASQIATAADHRYSAALVDALSAAGRALDTPRDLSALIADINATMDAATPPDPDAARWAAFDALLADAVVLT